MQCNFAGLLVKCGTGRVQSRSSGGVLTSRAPAQEGSPPPGVVLHCQLEVGQGNGDEGGDNDEDDEDDEEDGVDGVHLVAPHAGKDVVQLNVDGAEGQEACTGTSSSQTT